MRTVAIGFIYTFSVVEIVVAAAYIFACVCCGIAPHLMGNGAVLPVEAAIVFLLGGIARLMLIWIFQNDHSHVCEATNRVRAVNDRMAESVFGEEADKAREKIRLAADVARADLHTEIEQTMSKMRNLKPIQS